MLGYTNHYLYQNSSDEGRVWWKNAEACQDVSSEERICIPKIGSAATLDDWIFLQCPFLPCEKIMKENLWMASGFDTEFNPCFPVDFYPPQPATTPQAPKQTSTAKAGELHSSWKGQGVAKKMSWGVAMAMVRWSGGKDGGAPRHWSLTWSFKTTTSNFPKIHRMGIFGLAIWKCLGYLEDGCGIWCYFSDWRRNWSCHWDETEIRLRDDAIRPNWVLCATATKPAKLSLEENREAPGEVGTPFKCSADSWSGGVVGGDEEGTKLPQQKHPLVWRDWSSWYPHFLDRTFDSLRGKKNVRYDHFEVTFFFPSKLVKHSQFSQIFTPGDTEKAVFCSRHRFKRWVKNSMYHGLVSYISLWNGLVWY